MHTQPDRNLTKFFVFRFLWDFQLFLPIWVIFLQDTHGLSLTQVALLDGAFWLTMVLGEVPTGIIADTSGRKRSLSIAVALSALAIGLFALAPTYPLLFLANTLWALALTFDSGAALSLLYDVLRTAGRAGEYTRLRGRLEVVIQVALAVSSGLGGVLGAIDLRLPFLGYAAILPVALALVLRLEEPPRTPPSTDQTSCRYWSTLGRAVQVLTQHASLRYMMLYTSLPPLATFLVGVIFWQPHARALGVPIASLGFIVLGLRGVRMLGALFSHRVITHVGERRWFHLLPLAVVAGLLGLGVCPSLWGLVCFALVGFVVSATEPVVEHAVLRQVPPEVQATLLSLDSLLFRLLLVVAVPSMGMLGDAYGLPTAFLALAGGIGVRASAFRLSR